MPPSAKDEDDTASEAKDAPRTLRRVASSILTIPPPVKYLFERTPLLTYPPNELPASSLYHADGSAKPVLYIFCDRRAARRGAPSFNPSCLKWQTYLHFHRILFDTRASTNHASPTGALPFLLPPSTASTQPQPVPASRLVTWTRKHSDYPHPTTQPQTRTRDLHQAPYHALLTHAIRLAYLHALYLHPTHFTSYTKPLYVDPVSNNTLVRSAIAWSLRSAALGEVLGASSAGGAGKVTAWGGGGNNVGGEKTLGVDTQRIYVEADEAFEALSTLLGNDEWFEDESAGDDGKGQQRPGLLDAAVFSYAYVFVTVFKDEDGKESPGGRLRSYVLQRRNLNAFVERVLKVYYGISDPVL